MEVSLEKLIKSGAHFGHTVRRWNPNMEPYIHSVKEGVHIFDLIKTKEKLEEALDFLQKSAEEKKSILFLCTKRQAKEKLEEVAKATNSFYVSQRWLGGTITNFDQIKKSPQRLTELKEKMEKGEFSDRTKKERVLIQRDIDKLEKFFGGIVGMDTIPDVLVVVDTKREHAAVREAKMKGVKTVAIVDTNADPTMVDYEIPMNDDASNALDYVLDLMQEAILSASSKSKKQKKKSKAKKKKVEKKTSVKTKKSKKKSKSKSSSKTSKKTKTKKATKSKK